MVKGYKHVKPCCNIKYKNTKKCIRKDGKVFSLPRRFTKKQCVRPRGFSMISSCAPYKFCGKSTKISSSKSKQKTQRREKKKNSGFKNNRL